MLGDVGRSFVVFMVFAEFLRSARQFDEADWSLPVVSILVSKPLDDSSSPKRFANFLWRVLLLVLALRFELELLTVVALAIDGRLSSPKNSGSGESLAPVRPVSGRNDGEAGALPRPSSKKLASAAPGVKFTSQGEI